MMLDFQERCAYSMQHINRASGKRNMQVDHFNPHLKKLPIQEYSNLFLSTSHCNGAKSDRWPKNRDKREHGIRFLDCTKEVDYGVHILEDPDTHELVGMTPAGRYHVTGCDLNAPQFVQERAQRAKCWEFIRSKAFSGSESLPPEIQLMKEIAEKMIPEIEFLSGEALEKHREKRRERDKLVADDMAVNVVAISEKPW
ncbi:MAG TPA: hypothetical protein VFC07_03600 [Verrucomicrobiae bacterium]|nr:hypothetical protein [Verrucomicrobiae bacterium]